MGEFSAIQYRECYNDLLVTDPSCNTRDFILFDKPIYLVIN